MPPAPSNDNSADAIITKPLWLPPPPQLRPRHSPDAPHQSHLTPTPPMLTIARPLWSPPAPQPRPRHSPSLATLASSLTRSASHCLPTSESLRSLSRTRPSVLLAPARATSPSSPLVRSRLPACSDLALAPRRATQTGPRSSRCPLDRVACNRLLGRLLLTPQLLMLRVGRFYSLLQPRVAFSRCAVSKESCRAVMSVSRSCAALLAAAASFAPRALLSSATLSLSPSPQLLPLDGLLPSVARRCPCRSPLSRCRVCPLPVPAFACRHTSVRRYFTDFMSMYVAPGAVSPLLSFRCVYSGVDVGPNELRVMGLLPNGSVCTHSPHELQFHVQTFK